MCHLTATGQTKLRDVTLQEFGQQADEVLTHYQSTSPAKSVHFNFMARGEPLNNQTILTDADTLLGDLAVRANVLKLRPRYLISTILPKTLGDRRLEDIFRVNHPEFYYSLYSVEPGFRQKWLPKAMPVDDALDRLLSWQRSTYKVCKIHYAFIAGENDNEADVHAICDALERRKLMAHINIVRYNPADSTRGVEPSEAIINRNVEIYLARLPYARVTIVSRVGFDVAASCGMFLKSDGSSLGVLPV